MKLLIAGIDPGLNTGIALIDLDGNIIYLKTKKSPKNSDVLRIFLDHGKIIAIGTDTHHASKTVKKIASSLSLKVTTPIKDLTRKRKRLFISELLGNKEKEIKMDSHQKSALSSAIYVYKKYRPTFKKLSDKIKNERDYKILRKLFILEKGMYISDFLKGNKR